MATSPTPSASPAAPPPLGVRAQISALAAGPCAWIAQLAVDYGVSSYTCSPGDTPRVDLPGASEHGLLLAINLACLALALTGFAISLSGWRKLRAGAAAVVEGRRGFLAKCGLLASAIFAVAILFDTPSALALRLCWSAPR